MPQLRQWLKALQAELVSIGGAVADQQAVLRIANNLESLLSQLQNAADTIDVKEWLKTLRLVDRSLDCSSALT